MKKYIIILIASMMATVVTAQDITPQVEYEFYQKAYDIIVSYNENAQWETDEEKKIRWEKLKTLFEDTNVSVCNDLMGFYYDDTDDLFVDSLSIYKYYMSKLRKAESVEITVSSIRKKGSIVDKGDVWQMDVMFDKAISILTKDYKYFDSKSFYGEDYHIIATLTMEKEDDHRCYISALRSNGEWPTFPKDYRILQKKELDDRDNKLYINDKVKVEYNTYGQYILRPEDKVYYNRGEVALHKIDPEDVKYEADYKDKSWRVRIGGAFALSEFNKLNEANSLTVSKNGETALGLDFGYVFPTTGNLHIGIFAGVGLSMNSLTMELKPTKNDCKATNVVDVDGDTYTRIYNIDNSKGIVQEMKATDIAIPLYVDFEYELNYLFSVYADLGMKIQTSSGKMTADIGSYKTWGEYNKPEYGGFLEIGKNEDIDILDFKNNKTSIEIEEGGVTKSMALDALLGLGLRLNLNKSIAIDAGVQYQMGGKSWKTDNSSIFSYSLEDGDKVNLLQKSSGISHNALKVAASLILKF